MGLKININSGNNSKNKDNNKRYPFFRILFNLIGGVLKMVIAWGCVILLILMAIYTINPELFFILFG